MRTASRIVSRTSMRNTIHAAFNNMRDNLNSVLSVEIELELTATPLGN
ncbi:protein of unknown function [Candidatus Nitrotoga arctica]|uniref:Uncharacterized protein n=1 Tax=Candidatus Nitrotoga arctica TaxID=453162 RepID=A0ABM8YZA5_9PROT|nr:protein of unknown function [Candidatus Nitrotoga arctica]